MDNTHGVAWDRLGRGVGFEGVVHGVFGSEGIDLGQRGRRLTSDVTTKE